MLPIRERSRLDDVADPGYEERVLDGLFPEGVVTESGDPIEPSRPLFPEERALVARAVPTRQREFAKGRECARKALERFGHGDVMLLSGSHREPLWPAEIRGSITHTSGLCVVAVTLASRYHGLGIDAEPRQALAPEVVRRVCRDDDRRSFGNVKSVESAVLPRLVFSAKEAVYKCLFPMTRTFLGFEDVSVELDEGGFRAVLCVPAVPFAAGTALVGRWRMSDSHLVTGTWLAAL